MGINKKMQYYLETEKSVYQIWSVDISSELKWCNLIQWILLKHHQFYSILFENHPEYDIIVLHSDYNYQIKLKLKADRTISYYRFPISYNITKI